MRRGRAEDVGIVRSMVWKERMNPLISERSLREDFVVAVDDEADTVVGCGQLRRSASPAAASLALVAWSTMEITTADGAAPREPLLQDSARSTSPSLQQWIVP